MSTTTVFTSNRSQAVRLPKDVAFPEGVKKVTIIPVGNGRLVIPESDTWASWFETEGVSADFMVERDQPADQEREDL